MFILLYFYGTGSEMDLTHIHFDTRVFSMSHMMAMSIFQTPVDCFILLLPDHNGAIRI